MYIFPKELYDYAKHNKDKIAWKDFAKGRVNFPDYGALANPKLIRGSKEYNEWKEYFDGLFKCSCNFPFILRIVNSLLVTGAKKITL